MVEWDKRTRELKKKEMLQKQQAWDRGEETGSDDDDDDEFDEVVTDVDWDVLEIGTVPSTNSILNSTSLSGGKPGNSSGNTFGNSQTTGIGLDSTS